ncbi:hypothetical protein DEM27_13895 [Metarhizobium album]|uniref:Uncharacterized protein n=1 Tax=Metarhizobium album TaxID=2182425 RepID=A0A2U2DR38_9HYPH|nr:hypothetical protein DEM27_13895 [Rhizobium album]
MMPAVNRNRSWPAENKTIHLPRRILLHPARSHSGDCETLPGGGKDGGLEEAAVGTDRSGQRDILV